MSSIISMALVFALAGIGVVAVVTYVAFRIIYWVYSKVREDGGWQ